jgi:LPXTG-motif cell wall-anchored protein
MRREFFTPVGNQVQRGARRRARLGALAVTTVLGLAVIVSAALPASATRAGGERNRDDRLPVTVSCHVVASTVFGGVATFTVGPRGCEGQTPPLSFSTYTLKDGLVLPFTSQVAFAHAAGNGASYGAGSYTLVAALPECNWQSDLYLGASQPSAPHIHPIAGMNVGWDFREGNVCASVPSTSPSTASATPSPTPSPTDTPSATPTDTLSAMPTDTLSATPTPTPTPTRSSSPSTTTSATPGSTPSAAPTYVSEVLSAGVPSTTPTPTPSPSTTYVSEVLDAQANLAATGSSTGPVLGVAVVLLVAGGLLVTLRRRSGQRS